MVKLFFKVLGTRYLNFLIYNVNHYLHIHCILFCINVISDLIQRKSIFPFNGPWEITVLAKMTYCSLHQLSSDLFMSTYNKWKNQMKHKAEEHFNAGFVQNSSLNCSTLDEQNVIARTGPSANKCCTEHHANLNDLIYLHMAHFPLYPRCSCVCSNVLCVALIYAPITFLGSALQTPTTPSV